MYGTVSVCGAELGRNRYSDRGSQKQRGIPAKVQLHSAGGGGVLHVDKDQAGPSPRVLWRAWAGLGVRIAQRLKNAGQLNNKWRCGWQAAVAANSGWRVRGRTRERWRLPEMKDASILRQGPRLADWQALPTTGDSVRRATHGSTASSEHATRVRVQAAAPVACGRLMLESGRGCSRSRRYWLGHGTLAWCCLEHSLSLAFRPAFKPACPMRREMMKL